LRLTTFTEYLFANGLLRFRIPLLFLISGYLYASGDNKPYLERTRKRMKTLLLPYLIWSAVGLLITYLWQQGDITMQALQRAKIDQLGDNRPYTEIGWNGILLRWLLSPVAFHLWFILFLFIYDLAYPFFKWVIMKYPAVWLSLTFLYWFSGIQLLFFHGIGIFFFSVGIWLNKKHIIIDRKPSWYSHYLAWLVYIGFSIIKTFMAFEVDSSITSGAVMTFLYCGATIAGIMAFWFGADALVKWCMNQKWFVWATSFSFIIYALHNPLVIYVTNLLLIWMAGFPLARLSCYVLVPALTVIFCIGAGALLRQYTPALYRLVTGGRGLV
jgi:fucose 4-O-acetylase-like acetyltransferase